MDLRVDGAAMLGRLSWHQIMELVYQEGYVEGCVMCLSRGVRWVNSGKKLIGWPPSAFDRTHFTLGKNQKFLPLMVDVDMRLRKRYFI